MRRPVLLQITTNLAGTRRGKNWYCRSIKKSCIILCVLFAAAGSYGQSPGIKKVIFAAEAGIVAAVPQHPHYYAYMEGGDYRSEEVLQYDNPSFQPQLRLSSSIRLFNHEGQKGSSGLRLGLELAYLKVQTVLSQTLNGGGGFSGIYYSTVTRAKRQDLLAGTGLNMEYFIERSSGFCSVTGSGSWYNLLGQNDEITGIDKLQGSAIHAHNQWRFRRAGPGSQALPTTYVCAEVKVRVGYNVGLSRLGCFVHAAIPIKFNNTVYSSRLKDVYLGGIGVFYMPRVLNN